MKISYANRFTTEEKETLVLIHWTTKEVIIQTSEQRYMTKCKKAGYELIEQILDKDDRTTVIQQTFKTEPKYISFRKSGELVVEEEQQDEF